MMVFFLMACTTTSINGLVDGQEIAAHVSMFIEQPDVLEDDDLVTVVLSTIPNACRVYEYYLDLYADNPTWRGHAIAWQKAFPDDFWEVSLIVRVASLSPELAGTDIVGVRALDDLVDPSTLYGEVTHFIDHPDPDDPTENGYYDPYLTDGGLLSVTKAETGLRFKGDFTTRIVDADRGAPKGDVEMQFDASVCPNVFPFGQP